MSRQLLFSMCNQSRHGRGRTHCLGLLNVKQGKVRWIRSGTTRRDFGITGLAKDGHGYYAAVQAHDGAIRIMRYHPETFEILSSFFLKHTGDPHSLTIHNGDLLIASTSNNAIYHLQRKNGDVVSEELYWRYPGASEFENDVHLNCLASHESVLYATAFGPRGPDGKFGMSGELRNITTGDICLSKLHQPHTILFANDRLYCASSASGEVVIARHASNGWQEKRVKLCGYTRGLAAWEGGVVVGVSAHRTQSRSKGNLVSRPENYSENSQIIQLNENGSEEKAIIDTTRYGTEIYEIMTIESQSAGRFPKPVFSSRLESLRTSMQRSS